MLSEKIVTDRLIIRKPMDGDHIAVFENWAQDKEVLRYLRWTPHKSLDITKEFIDLCLKKWNTQEEFSYMICLKESGEVIGMIASRENTFRSEIAYVLAKPHWNKGYMTEAAKVLIEEVLKIEKIYRVYALCDPENKASAAVMEKAGMTYEGLLRKWSIHPNISNIPRDCLIYSVTK
jgi:ribosomal-protein-alanine N-acetyltransferase